MLRRPSVLCSSFVFTIAIQKVTAAANGSKRFFKTDSSESWLDCYLGIDWQIERVDGLL